MAGRWLGAVAHPVVHAGEQGAHQRADVDGRCGQQAASLGLGQGVKRGEVRGACHEVGAHVGGQGQVLGLRVGHALAAVRCPHFVFRIDLHDARAGAGGGAALQQAVGATSLRIGAGGVGHGELVYGVQVVAVGAGVAGGLGKAGVGVAAAPAGDLQQQAVVHGAVVGAFVKAQVDKVAQHAA